MRLLKTCGSDAESWQPELVDFRGEEYAILSHRWLPNANDEVLFADIRIIDDGGYLEPSDHDNGRRHKKYYINPSYSHRPIYCIPGYEKLRGAARQAAYEGHEFIWVDTCCIDKSSSAELSEGINSMYQWYRQSEVCFAYLTDVPNAPIGFDTSINSAFAKSEWWTRGWTLQELVAPLNVVFYTQGWEVIGEKKALGSSIFAISGIGTDVLTHARILDQVSVARRMSWASSRRTTRIEDWAYSLMGIFNVNMPLLYGEGEKAFLRLQEEIMKSSDDESIFAWVDPSARDEEPHGLLARSPAYFSKSSEIIYYQDFEDREPYVMSNRGLSITLRLSRCNDGKFAAALQCPVAHTGEGFLAVFLKRLADNSQQFARVKCSKLGSLQQRGKLETIYVRQHHQTHRLDSVLPYHFFNLRRLIVSEEDERYQLIGFAHGGQTYQQEQTTAPFPTSHAKNWIRKCPGAYSVLRGEGKLSVALLFGTILEEPVNNENQAHTSEKKPEAGLLVVMLGSTSMTEVSFDAYQMGHLAPFSELKTMFKPHTASQWKELDDFHVKVDYKTQVSGGTQLFLTDISIAKVTRASPFDLVTDLVTETFTHHVEPFVPLLHDARSPDMHPQLSRRSGWRRLLRDR